MDTIKDNFNKIRQLNRDIIVGFIKNKWRWIVIIAVAITFFALFIEYSYMIRVPRYLRDLGTIVKYVELEPVSECLDYIKDYKLADFYVASSARSYLSGYQYDDYATERATERILRAGARFLEFEIFNKNFNNDTIPVVSTGVEDGNILKTLNLLPFEECCKVIEKVAFSEKYVSNYSDPLFISIILKTNRNYETINKVADIIQKYLGQRLLSRKYAFSKKNIAQEPLKNLIGKVIIFCTKDMKGTKLEELTNQTWNTPYLRENNYEAIQETADHTYLIDWNRRNITKVHPDRNDKYSNNYNPHISWRFGCQFVCMNYQQVDNHMKDNIITFSKRSFVLKPKNLRYKPIYYSRPKKQDPNLSLQNMTLKAPGMNITL
tara:strand:- start:198 stop:1328 length:1131 start_codon:yes stop_codon:yes gene_type:complete